MNFCLSWQRPAHIMTHKCCWPCPTGGRLRAPDTVTKLQRQNTLELRKTSEFHKPILALASHFHIQDHICYPCEEPGYAPRFQNKRCEVDVDSYAGSQAVKIFLVPKMWLIFASAVWLPEDHSERGSFQQASTQAPSPSGRWMLLRKECSSFLWWERIWRGRWRENPWVNPGPHTCYEIAIARDLHLQPRKSSPQSYRDS